MLKQYNQHTCIMTIGFEAPQQSELTIPSVDVRPSIHNCCFRDIVDYLQRITSMINEPNFRSSMECTIDEKS